ncbi:hypothetical protein L7F22_016343 [Adiantum nelumboides]|nr:hypothetical protein [Adiantum nelumboides]
MSDGIGNNDQQASNQSNQVSGTRKLRQGPVRTESASSSSSFDSCSDLLGSLENAEENLDVLSSLHDTDCREFEPKDDDNCHQASLQSEGVLAKAPFEQCERSVTEEALLDPEVKDEGVMMQSTAVKDHVYGFSNAISFSTVKFLAENTVERISQLQTSFRLPTSYIFSSKNLPQTDDTQNSDVQTGAETEASNIHKEHLLEKESHLREAGDNLENAERKAFMETNTFSPKQSGDVLPITHKDATSKSNILDDTHAGGFLFKEKPNALEEGLNRVFSENSLNLEDINDATTLIEDDVQISNVSTSNIVPMVFKNNTNSIVTADASSRGSEAEKSKLSDPDREANREGLQSLVEQVLKEDSGSQRIQGPIPSSDFCTKSPTFCHPLRSLSSGSGRPDLEEVDDEQNMAWGMLPNGPLVDLFDTAPVSTETLLNVEAHLGVNNEADIHKGINLDNDAHTGSLYQSSGVQNTGSFTPSCSNQGRGLTSSGQPTLAESVDRANSECTQGLLLKEQASGDILHEDKWKGLSIRLQSKLENDQREQKNNLGPDELCRYVENLQLNETYVDTVLDMEDVLLNGDEHGIRERFLLGSSSSVIGTPRSSRDGSLSSSTSGLQLFTLAESTPFTVDWVEVVGAKQRRGGSSFGERIVGVKDHTVYCIKVSSGNQEWEVLRRYRDFVDLYHQLRRKFNARTKKSLPSPWREVDRDSRKIFGSTHPNAVEVRSSRIENCLQSLLQAGPPFSTSSSLCWFLRPQSSVMGSSFSESNYWTSAAASQRSDVQLGSIESPYLQSPQSELEGHKGELDYNKSSVSLGKTVKLNLKTHPRKNTKQLLSSQHYSCAGCYKHLEAERGLMHGFVQTLGWGKPRLCEYSGQLYCTSCHLNETAVLPAQVLWHWDFTPRRVSQLAKAYLDSIYDQVTTGVF